VEWAAAWPDRAWAVEGAGGLGHLLAQQLVAAGERVLDIQPKLGSRVRLLSSGRANKNDPNDALSVAVAGLRSPRRREVRADGPATALKLWAKRHRDLARLRNQAACRLHSLLASLAPGGIADEITPAQAERLLAGTVPSGPAAQARHQLAAEHVADPAARHQGQARRRGHGVRHQLDRGIRHRPGHRRPGDRRRRGHHPVRYAGRLRRL
jgi:hypothetical protein